MLLVRIYPLQGIRHLLLVLPEFHNLNNFINFVILLQLQSEPAWLKAVGQQLPAAVKQQQVSTVTGFSHVNFNQRSVTNRQYLTRGRFSKPKLLGAYPILVWPVIEL